MAGAPPTATLRLPPTPPTILDAEGLVVPAAGAAIAKAITGAYLSSSGNAFSTRTASQIVQQFFRRPRDRRARRAAVRRAVQPASLLGLSARFNAAGGARRLSAPTLAARPVGRSGRLSAL